MKRTQQGMTLLEVLVALSIFSIAALSVIKSVSQHIDTLSYLEEKTFASIVADNELTKLRLGEAYPTSTKKGQSTLAGREWYWTIKGVNTSDGYLRAMDISVATDKARKNSVVSFRTYVEK